MIGALDEEIEWIHSSMEAVSDYRHAGITVSSGLFRDCPIVLAKCGIGKVNAAICTQMLIDRFEPDRLLFSGVAGGLLPNMRVGDLVIASHLIQYDINLTVFGRRPGELPGEDRMIESDPAMVNLASDAYDQAFTPGPAVPNLMVGTVVSGDKFISDQETLRWLQREFAAVATEMEGAAVGYTCRLNGVPFVVIRGLSDTAGDTARKDFDANLKLVCQNSYKLIDLLIPMLGRDDHV
ncbi:5'-methylthioadenosine/adenosylhomocysteine nucleosidase [Aestuariispira insulae]|uniref:5'-methylthioadenosine/adenosylhomocysteine nucleosidase n=1 Tax=Aestuariispira insulae TaxID=1461337 RepID=UPI001FE3E363|nr:5'-methylthioadenosine/adenosylhomocysteine nucleosidase [Aestuariispira insulae]